MLDLKGKTVIITGGSRGIGRACVLAFAQVRANIVFTYNKSKEKADELFGEVEKLGVSCLSLQIDTRDYEQCRMAVEKTLAQFKSLDILVNNAGITRDKALIMMALDDWKEVIDTNLGGTFNMTRAAITTLLKQKKGCIINMSSVSGITGLARQTNYSASKAGIIGFSKALAKEVAAYNIRVNAVCPGFINTEIVNALHENIKKEIVNTIPVKRIGEAEEVADLCVFLASDKASYITGEAIKIDGGLAI
jgi:3-oxoacyl-[acyl-carrier protein] reductase